MKTLSMKNVATLGLLGCLLVSASVSAAMQKKKKGRVQTPTRVTTTIVNTTPPAAEAPPSQATETPMTVEKDPSREFWRIQVEPYAILGSGRPGKEATDFDKPDGVAFTPNGLLLATDAKNRRIQIWDVAKKIYLADFGRGIFGGEIVDIAIAPNGTVLVTDQVLNLAYCFVPPAQGEKDEKGKPLSPYDYQFKGTRFGDQQFSKLGGIAIDSRNRVYTVDANLNDVRRFTLDGKVDPSWQFTKQRADGNTYLHGCEGIAIDEAAGRLYVASEKDAVIVVFDWETGNYQGKLLGNSADTNGKPLGKSIFSGSVEGLALAGKTLFAVDENVGHIHVFDTQAPSVFNADLNAFQNMRRVGYKGFFGHTAQVNFEDKNNKTVQQQLKDGAIIPGQANPPGYFCSPDAVAVHTAANGETYIAIADQCNYRLAVYRWSDINLALNTVPPAPRASGTVAPKTPVIKRKGRKKA